MALRQLICGGNWTARLRNGYRSAPERPMDRWVRGWSDRYGTPPVRLAAVWRDLDRTVLGVTVVRRSRARSGWYGLERDRAVPPRGQKSDEPATLGIAVGRPIEKPTDTGAVPTTLPSGTDQRAPTSAIGPAAQRAGRSHRVWMIGSESDHRIGSLLRAVLRPASRAPIHLA